jgi:hypothetical protein
MKRIVLAAVGLLAASLMPAIGQGISSNPPTWYDFEC